MAERIVYDRKSKLGKGSFGTVYRGTLDGQWPVAVKRVLFEDDDTMLPTIQKEAELLTEVGDHPNVLRHFHTEKDQDFV